MSDKEESNPESNLSGQLAQAFAMIQEAAQAAASMVEKGPDNPAIRRLGQGGAGSERGSNAFVISSAALMASNNLSVYFHDWKSQYEDVAELLRNRRFGAVKSILRDGKYNKTPFDKRVLAPQVVTKLREILGDMNEISDESTKGVDGLDGPQSQRTMKSPKPH